jgi:hypothetical protein
LAKALDCLPDSRYGGSAILELLDLRFAGRAIPDFDQPGRGPVGRQLRQRSFVAESFRVRDRFGFLCQAVDGDVVRFVFNRKVLHFRSPGAASAAISTFIALAAPTSKRIMHCFQEIMGEVWPRAEQAMRRALRAQLSPDAPQVHPK